MSRVRSSQTLFEKKVFYALKKRGIQFRRNYSKVFGKPDIALPIAKKAVFLHSDFWHGWRLSRWEHILPNDFWKKKLAKNRARDRKVLMYLRREGWKVLTIWEHQLKRDFERVIERISIFLKE